MKRKIVEIIPVHHRGAHVDDEWKQVDAKARKAGHVAGQYHYFITRTGDTQPGRPHEWSSGHTTASTAARCISIGVNIPLGMRWTNAQRKAFEGLVNSLKILFKGIQMGEVYGL